MGEGYAHKNMVDQSNNVDRQIKCKYKNVDIDETILGFAWSGS